jgi:hypothetical protein
MSCLFRSPLGSFGLVPALVTPLPTACVAPAAWRCALSAFFGDSGPCTASPSSSSRRLLPGTHHHHSPICTAQSLGAGLANESAGSGFADEAHRIVDGRLSRSALATKSSHLCDAARRSTILLAAAIRILQPLDVELLDLGALLRQIPARPGRHQPRWPSTQLAAAGILAGHDG